MITRENRKVNDKVSDLTNQVAKINRNVDMLIKVMAVKFGDAFDQVGNGVTAEQILKVPGSANV